jgi:Ala-tRNA(Pro) deacylase
MAINERLSVLIQQRGAVAELLPHKEVFTAQEVAHSSHLSGRKLAKVVVLRDGEAYLMAVLPANEHVDVEEMRRVTKKKGLELANEEEMRRLFPDCELGAMPPFGHLYGLTMYLDPCLKAEDIWFQAGNHHEVVRMPFETYARLAKPYDGSACLHKEPSHAG